MRAKRVLLLGIVALAAIAAGIAWWLDRGRSVDATAPIPTNDATAATRDVVPLAATTASPPEPDAQPTIADDTDESGRSEEIFAPEVPAAPLRIHGRVTSKESGEPIAGAEVSADARETGFGDAVITDADGRYTMTAASFDFYELKVEARAAGFGRREQRTGEFVGDDLTLDFELMKARRASGRVVDVAGRPIAGAIVSAHAAIDGSAGDMVDFVETRSHADGSFLLTDLRPDLVHLLQVRRSDYGRRVYAFLADEKAFEEVEFGDLVLTSETRLLVTVTDDGGAPLEGIAVRLRGGNADWMRFAVIEPSYNRSDLWETDSKSDAQGHCRFDGLASGNWQLTSFARDRPTAPPIDVVVSGKEPVQEVAITFPRGLSIAGRVVDDSGRPLGGANVYVQPKAAVGERILWVLTDDAGRFAVRGLEAGDHRVWTGDVMFLALRDETDPGSAFVAAGRDDVELHGRRIEHDTIRGIVRDPDGHPVAYSPVKVFFSMGGCLVVKTRVGGRFAVSIPRGDTVALLAGPDELWPPTLGDRYDLTGLPTVNSSTGEIALTYALSR
jgi:protocatechuate 3,4-dioxygenase beta subunit